MRFYELAVGAPFIFRGRRFEKIAMGMANNEQGHGSVFLGETVVVPDGLPLLLPPEEAAKWKPDDRHWTEHLSPAPPPRELGPRAPATGRPENRPASPSSG
jgi:hypothetical protein